MKQTTSAEVRGVPRSPPELTLAGAAQQSFVEAFSSSYQALLADALKDLEPAARRKLCGDADGMGWWGGPLDPNVWGNLGVHGDFMWYLMGYFSWEFPGISTCFKVDHISRTPNNVFLQVKFGDGLYNYCIHFW